MSTIKPLKIIFAGTPEFAASHLQALLTSPHQLVAVLTQPDKPAGRGKKLSSSAVKQLAEQHQLPVLQPSSLRSVEVQQQLTQFAADIMVVVAYGLILPQAVLDLPRLGCINVHGSLLPRWRGAAPIQRAIWAGDTRSGVTIMQMDRGLDTGDMLYQVACPITAEETSLSLYQKLAQIGPEALLTSLTQLAQGEINAEKQNDTQANYAEKLSKAEAKLDWQQSASQLARNIRAFNPWPVAFFMLNEQPIKVWQAHVIHAQHGLPPGTIAHVDKQGIQIATGQDILQITHLQLAGKKSAAVQELLHGRADLFIAGQLLN